MGLFYFFSNGNEKTVPPQITSATKPVTTPQKDQWIELKNTKYGYSLSRPVNLGVIVDGDGTGDGQIPVTEGMDIGIANMGRPGNDWFNIYVVNPNKYPRIKKEFEPDSSLSVILSKAYDANLFIFTKKFRDENTHKTNLGFETKVSEIKDIEVSGQKGYIFTVATTYTGKEQFDYPPTGLPYIYIFLENDGNKFILNFQDNNPISQKILASFKFE